MVVKLLAKTRTRGSVWSWSVLRPGTDVNRWFMYPLSGSNEKSCLKMSKNFVVPFSFTVSNGQLTSEPAVVRVIVDGELRRELDGDASWFGCTAAPGVRGDGGVRGHVRAGKGGDMSPHSRIGSHLALLLIGLGLVV